MTRIFLTGVNGFIGSHLAEYLLERGCEVTGLVRPTSDLRSVLPLSQLYGARFSLAVGDVRDGPSVEGRLDGIDYVFHLAAVLMGSSEREFQSVNVGGTKVLLEAVMRRSQGSLRRFVFVSSQAAAGPSPTAEPIGESRPPDPVSWYGASKRDAERLVHAYAARGLPTTIVRPVAVYGEREQDISRGTFPAVRCGLAPRIGFAEKVLSVVYVGDLVQGMVAAAECPGAVGRTYFLADPQPYRASQFVGSIADAMGKKVRIPVVLPHFALTCAGVLAEWAQLFTRTRPPVTRDKVREIRQRFWAASPDSARRDFGWAARTSLVDGMRRTTRDWRGRSQVQRHVTAAPLRDRVVQTYSLAVLLGALMEWISWLAHWYAFHPPWFIVVAVVGFFGGVLGSISFWTAEATWVLPFGLGATAFAVVEIANHRWFHLWEFAERPFGHLDPWVRTLTLAVPVGAVAVVICALVRRLYGLRLRLG